jgi:hypothetical protein
MYPVRRRYLLARDFQATIKKWRESPEQLDKEILDNLEKATEYGKDLRKRDLAPDQVSELVNNLIAPTDIPDREPTDWDLYEEAMGWAVEQGAKMRKERESQKQT